MNSIARLDPALARAIIDGFPNAPSWQSLECAKLVQSKQARASAASGKPQRQTTDSGATVAITDGDSLFPRQHFLNFFRLPQGQGLFLEHWSFLTEYTSRAYFREQLRALPGQPVLRLATALAIRRIPWPCPSLSTLGHRPRQGDD